MPQLPENIRPAVTLLAKHHFWLLAFLAPLVLLPMVLMARSGMQTEIDASRGRIKSKFDALLGVRGVNPHPNVSWSKEINAETDRVRSETLVEWKKFWESQEFLRVWPQELGPDFLDAVARLKTDGRLDRNMLARYQNTIPDVVRKLPGRMGADETMVDDKPAAVAGPGAAEARKRQSGALVVWAADDQRRLFDSFSWKRLPANPQAATAQVLLAQEELWVYGLLCDVIKRANKDAAGEHNAAIIRVGQLAVGYPAAEERPGGMGESRIVIPKDAAAAAGADAAIPMPGPPGGEGGPAAKPAHPRFGGAGAGLAATETIPGGEGAMAADPAAPLREWIYVDFEGKPLSAAAVATSPAARMVHLMPFTLRIAIDQRRIDALLVDLARQKVPIDVREVRINPGRTAGGDLAGIAGGPRGAGSKAGRTHDVDVELRGTVGLATPPSPAAIGIEPQAPPSGDAARAAGAPRAVGRSDDRRPAT
jgi:hypothetical protein